MQVDYEKICEELSGDSFGCTDSGNHGAGGGGAG